MTGIPAPDPLRVRATNIEVLRRLGLPIPPSTYPLIWEAGDTVELRDNAELTSRMAVLNVVLARCFGMPSDAAMAWLLEAHLLQDLTQPEWSFVASADGENNHQSFTLHLEAILALAWLLGLVETIDPASPAPDTLVGALPHLPSKESFEAWQARTNPIPCPATEAAIELDLHYCLDWSYLEAERRGVRLPGLIDSNAIGQRRWALEWAVVLRGPYQSVPVGWEDIDLSVAS